MPSVLLPVPFNHPYCGALVDRSLLPPGLRRGGARCSLAPVRKKGRGGLLFLLSDSIYMGTSGLGVYYAGQAGYEELCRGRGEPHGSRFHHHGHTMSTASVNCLPGSVRITPCVSPVVNEILPPSCSPVSPSS